MTRAANAGCRRTGIADGTPESSKLKGQLAKLGLHSMAASSRPKRTGPPRARPPTPRTWRGWSSWSWPTRPIARSMRAQLAPASPCCARWRSSTSASSRASRRRACASWPTWPSSTRRPTCSSSVAPASARRISPSRWAIRACQARRSVLFTAAPDLLDQLVAAEVSHTLGKLLDQLRRLDLLVVDELGYLPMDGRRANLFFQLVALKYTKRRSWSPATSPSTAGASCSATR